MVYIFGVLLFLAIGSLIFFRNQYLKEKNRRKEKDRSGNPYPVPLAKLSDFLPSELFDQFGKKEREKFYLTLVDGEAADAGASYYETMILAAFSKVSYNMFEFGTCTGRTTYLWALNSSQEAKITTLTLPPENIESYIHADTDTEKDKESALKESKYNYFYYSDQPEEKKVTQLYGDSKNFDTSPYENKMDLIFIDGSHSYSYVLNDTEKALKMLKPGGFILWHDYRGPWETVGVYHALNKLSAELGNLKRIPKTSIVIYKKPL